MTEEDEHGTNELSDPGFEQDEAANLLEKPLCLGRALTNSIAEHPEICLGIALAIGVAVGLLVKRR
jgi:hypothetical protein